MNQIDLNDDLKIYRFGNGVKLIRPDYIDNVARSWSYRDTQHTVASILRLPFCVYFSDIDVCQKMNETTAEASGFNSLEDACGGSLRKVLTSESAEQIEKNDREVLRFNTIKIAEENSVRQDGEKINVLSIKLPWYDDTNKVIGLVGCSVVLGRHSLAESLAEITRIGFLNSSDKQLFSLEQHQIQFSAREAECLEWLARGYTTRAIAKTLGLSTRTVENYIANVKTKLNVSSKDELLEKFYNIFYPKAS